MPQWPELTLALALALLAAFVIADRLARLVESSLRSILPDDHEPPWVDRPKRALRFFIFLLTAAALSIPALRIAGWTPSDSPDALGQWLFDPGLPIAVTAIAGYIAVRFASAASRRFEHEMSTRTGLDAERAKRAQTLGRMVKNTLTVAIIAVAGLMILGELRVNIMPVLTGAGIVGLAVGFGAQTLVRDVISGFFLILEDQVRVGDVAVVNGQGGTVEAVNLRTIVLRDEEGTVHVVPNGEVKTLSNRSKDFSFYVVSVGMAYDGDPDAVIAAILDAGATLLEDPAFKPYILAPMEVYGVDDFQPGQIVIKGRIKTVPLKQWLVGRELRKRIAATLKARDIDLPVPKMNVSIEKLDELIGRRSIE
jgi:small conductance mechanosensitive channel